MGSSFRRGTGWLLSLVRSSHSAALVAAGCRRAHRAAGAWSASRSAGRYTGLGAFCVALGGLAPQGAPILGCAAFAATLSLATRSRAWGYATLFVLLIGGAALFTPAGSLAAIVYPELTYREPTPDPRHIAIQRVLSDNENRMRQASDLVLAHHDRHGDMPDLAAGTALVAAVRDVWGRPFIYERCPGDRYTIICTGRDGTLGTRDDISDNDLFYAIRYTYGRR